MIPSEQTQHSNLHPSNCKGHAGPPGPSPPTPAPRWLKCLPVLLPGGARGPSASPSRQKILPTWPQCSFIPSHASFIFPVHEVPVPGLPAPACRAHSDLISTLLMLIVPWGPVSSISLLLCCLHSLTLPWACTSQSVPAISCKVHSVSRIFVFWCP